MIPDTSTSFHSFDVVFLELSYSYLLIIDAEMAKKYCDSQHYESLNGNVGAYLVAAGSNGMSNEIFSASNISGKEHTSGPSKLFPERVPFSGPSEG